ncbi:MAG: MerR family transcriptional regulator [Actinomycetota bacterium]|nr:MerR family transcriptional regulator [Actinomycetota bacterium]
MESMLNSDASGKVNSGPRMAIGELSQLTGASARSLRYYEQRGLLMSSRAANGYRMYGDEATTIVRQIRAFLDAGLDTDTIRALLPCTRGNGEVKLCDEVNELLRGEVRRLEEHLAHVGNQREKLLRLINS